MKSFIKEIIVGLSYVALLSSAAYAGTTIWGSTHQSVSATNRIPVDISSTSGPGYNSTTDIVDVMSGDCTSAGGVVDCTKTGGVSFGSLATANVAPAGTLTGSTLASGVTASSLTSVGTITSGTWQATAIANAYLAHASTTVNGQTCTLGSTCTIGSGLTVGTTTITSGTTSYIEYNNGGVLGEYAISGSGSVMMTASPTATGTLTAPIVNATTIGTGYELNGANGLSFNSGDSTAGGSIAIGNGALSGQTTSAAYGSTAIGYHAMHGTMTTGGVDNTAVGYLAMTGLTSGASNTAVGWEAGDGITSAINDTVMGYQAEMCNDGGYNVVIGKGAGGSSCNTSMQQSVIIGDNAGLDLTSGPYNVFIGLSAGGQTTSGQENVAIGYSSQSGGGFGQTGLGNVSIGFETLQNITGSAGSNVAIGYQVGDTLTTGSNNILIGTAAMNPPANTTSSFLNIGNTIAGSMTAASGSNLSSCGGGTPAITGNDVKGTITEGTTASGCTFTFSTTRSSAPVCVVSSETGLTFSYTESTTALTITNIGALSSDKLDYICLGN